MQWYVRRILLLSLVRRRSVLYSPVPVPIHSQHLHRVDMLPCKANIRCIMRLPYCSNSRVKYLYDEQIKIMKELNVPVLDVFETSYLSADQHPFSDAIHYSTDFNMFILSKG
jgi:hypothetical protein